MTKGWNRSQLRMCKWKSLVATGASQEKQRSLLTPLPSEFLTVGYIVTQSQTSKRSSKAHYHLFPSSCLQDLPRKNLRLLTKFGSLGAANNLNYSPFISERHPTPISKSWGCPYIHPKQMLSLLTRTWCGNGVRCLQPSPFANYPQIYFMTSNFPKHVIFQIHLSTDPMLVAVNHKLLMVKYVMYWQLARPYRWLLVAVHYL